MTFSYATVVFSLAAVLLALATVMSVRSGRVLWYPAQIQAERSQHPVLFWSIIAAQLVGVAALAWLSFF